jgi:hypothetical protein
MYIRNLKISNLRTIADAEIDFRTPDAQPTGNERPNVTVLLGNNGAGKTTVLRAVAMAAMAPLLVGSSGWVPYCLVRREGGKAHELGVAAGVFDLDAKQDGPPASVTHRCVLRAGESFNDRADLHGLKSEPWSEVLWDERSPAGLVVGYGADRRVEAHASANPEARFKRRALRYGRVAGLFEESVTLVTLSSWLPAFRAENPGRYKQVVSLINKVIPDGDMEPQPVNGEFLFNLHGAALPFGALSDGYRAFIAWFADLLYHICMGAPSGRRLDETTGIVLVDEVDLHLHPAWQREVIPLVADALPRMQFVFTTHSPLVVGSLHKTNVFCLVDVADDKGGHSTEVQPLRAETFGLGAEQLLTGEAFGLESTRAPSFVTALRKTAARARADEPEAAVQFLRMMALGEGAAQRPVSPKPKRAPAASKPRPSTKERKAPAKKKAPPGKREKPEDSARPVSERAPERK